MAAEDRTSQDSAVIGDELVEALGFEPITAETEVAVMDDLDEVADAEVLVAEPAEDAEIVVTGDVLDLTTSDDIGPPADLSVDDDSLASSVEGDEPDDESAVFFSNGVDAETAPLPREASDEPVLHEAVVDEVEIDAASFDELISDDAAFDEASLDEASLDEVLEVENALEPDAHVDLDSTEDIDLDGLVPPPPTADDLRTSERLDLIEPIDYSSRHGIDLDTPTADGHQTETAVDQLEVEASDLVVPPIETLLEPTPEVAKARQKLRARKSRRVIRHIDPWSVLTFSVLFHLCFFAALLLASVLVWNAALAAGTIENLENFVRELGDYETFEINSDQVFKAAALIAGMLTLASSVLVVLLTVVFNLISDLIGGIRVTVIEEETVRIPKATKR